MEKEADAAILLSEYTSTEKKLKKNKEKHYIMMKEPNQPKLMNIINDLDT